MDPNFVWTSEDSGSLRDYLKTFSGAKLFQALQEVGPDLLGSGTSENIILRSGEVKGYAQAIESLIFLCQAENAVDVLAADNYPSIDDETQWKK